MPPPQNVSVSRRLALTSPRLLRRQPPDLVVLRVLRISEIEDDRRVRTRTTTVARKDGLEVNRAVEAQAAVVQDIDPVRLVVARRVKDRNLSPNNVNHPSIFHFSSSRERNRAGGRGKKRTYIAGLNEVPSHKQILLIRRDLNIVRPDDGLLLLRVVEALHVAQVRNVKGRDVVAERDGEVGELAVVADVRVDGDGLLGLVAQVVEELCGALLAVGAFAEGVDDPDLAGCDGAVAELRLADWFLFLIRRYR